MANVPTAVLSMRIVCLQKPSIYCLVNPYAVNKLHVNTTFTANSHYSGHAWDYDLVSVIVGYEEILFSIIFTEGRHMWVQYLFLTCCRT